MSGEWGGCYGWYTAEERDTVMLCLKAVQLGLGIWIVGAIFGLGLTDKSNVANMVNIYIL